MDGEKKSEHILLCLSPSPSCMKTLLAAEKMARAFQAELTALYVEAPEADGPRTDDSQAKARLSAHIHAAEKCGAHIATVAGRNVPIQIAEYARAAGVTKIVIGRSNHRRGLFFDKPTLTEQLIKLVPDTEVYIIPDTLPPYTGKTSARRGKQTVSLKYLLTVLVLTAITTCVGLGLKRLGFTEANIITVYILSVLLTAYLTEGMQYGFAASLLSVVVFNYLFTEPRFSLEAYGTGYPLTFIVMFMAAILTSSLTAKVKAQARSNAEKAYRTEVLLSASRNLQQAEGAQDILTEAARQISKLLGRVVMMYPAEDGALGRPLCFGGEDLPTAQIQKLSEETELAAARWTLENGRHAGTGTKTHSDARCLYLAVRARGAVYAVAGIFFESGDALEAFDKSLLLALLGECGLALEKQKLDEAKNALALTARQEQLRANLLRAISHDLRTPLTSISGNADMLLKGTIALDEAQKRTLYSDIYEDSMWLISLVENLLSITRMDDGALKLRMQPEMVLDVMEEAASHVASRLGAHHLTVRAEDELLMARMDAPLIIQVLVNLIDNAMKYTPNDSNIALFARREGQDVRLSVSDDGPGVPDELKARLFTMFTTGNSRRSDGRRGLGLGLALCRSIVKAHGGNIEVSDNEPHGAVFTFSLQWEEAVMDE
ncbi:MAG: DUF4118 domain-containing protein [Clostridia bacterium]